MTGVLEIDGQFIRNIIHDAADRALVTSINDIAHTLHIKTVAEFIEDANTLDLLRDINIDYAQGYYIHRPQALGD